MASEIVCAHRWRDKNNFIKQVDAHVIENHWWTSCQTCETVWYSDNPEPRVVMFRVEEKGLG
jgi:hypothetical protein